MNILAGLLLFFGSAFLPSADSTDEWLAGAIRTCDREEIVNDIINAERNKTTVIHIAEGCDADELLNSPFCWGHKTLDTGIAVACGDKDLNLPVIVRDNSRRNVISLPPISGGIFATASEDVDKKLRSTHHTTQIKKKVVKPKTEAKPAESKIERKQKVGKKPADKIDVIKSDEAKETTNTLSREDKLHCKYRLNCYDGDEDIGRRKRSVDEDDDGHRLHPSSVKDVTPTEDQLNTTDKSQLRLACKYRHSCYAKHGINSLADSDNKKAHIAQITTSKPSSIKPTSHHDIISTKDVASGVLRKVKNRENSHGNIPKLSQAEQLMSNKKELEKSKNVCKYRKSCYETGKLPKLEHSKIVETMNRLTSFFYESDKSTDEADENRQNFSNMTSAEQKLYCKYRKSCYESGVLPDSLHEKEFNYKDVIDNNRKEVPLALRCKYRKSCYETGILSLLSQNELKKEQELRPQIVILPSNPHELKLFCKYRKSCYKKMSEAGETEESTEEDDPKIQENDNDDTQDDVEENEEQIDEVQDDIEEDEEQITESVIVEEQAPIDDEASDEDSKDAEEDDDEIQNAPDVVLVPQKRKRPQNHQKVKPVKIPVGKDKESKRKEAAESFCDKMVGNDEFKSVIENEMPNSIRIKGKSPTRAKDYEETADNIVVISQKRHLRKLKKDEYESDQNEQEDDTMSDAKESQENDNEDGLVDDDVNPKENKNSEEKDDDSSVTDGESDSDESDEEEESDQPILNILINRRDKLDCKYRKSCYSESGDDLSSEQAHVNTKTQVYHSKDASALVNSDWSRIRKNEQLKCKYRKSCYQLKSMHEDKSNSAIKFAKEHSKTNRPLQNNPTSSHSPNNDEIADTAVLSKEAKLRCKFRHSCYETLVPAGERMMETRKSSSPSNTPERLINIPTNVVVSEDKNQIVFVLPNGTICSKYRISCQEQMGLQRKERAPVGPNGQKLCRKKGTTKM